MDLEAADEIESLRAMLREIVEDAYMKLTSAQIEKAREVMK
jgi:hypothetical protein